MKFCCVVSIQLRGIKDLVLLCMKHKNQAWVIGGAGHKWRQFAGSAYGYHLMGWNERRLAQLADTVG